MQTSRFLFSDVMRISAIHASIEIPVSCHHTIVTHAAIDIPVTCHKRSVCSKMKRRYFSSASIFPGTRILQPRN